VPREAVIVYIPESDNQKDGQIRVCLIIWYNGINCPNPPFSLVFFVYRLKMVKIFRSKKGLNIFIASEKKKLFRRPKFRYFLKNPFKKIFGTIKDEGEN
jgi:hypothetical protein